MFEDKDREIPEVEFTFEEEQKDEEERKMSQMKKIVIIPGTEDRKNRYE